VSLRVEDAVREPVDAELRAVELELVEPGHEAYFAAKRCLDVGVSATLLVLLAPLFAAIAVAIVADSGRPVFFTQERAGSRRRGRRGGVWEPRTFRVLKFRSMVRDADPAAHQAYIHAFVNGTAQPSSGSSAPFKLDDDQRITRIGALLRRTSLDELPQLVNVLVGSMSLVGPRPVPLYETASYGEHHRERLEALPGITGLWQIKGRGRVTFDEMVAMDLAYVRARSLRLDLKLLAQTLPAVFSRKGAG
jgi:lipopolysaccharide/colanic/teichoic acid biosynthesis glycosyltransferase